MPLVISLVFECFHLGQESTWRAHRFPQCLEPILHRGHPAGAGVMIGSGKLADNCLDRMCRWIGIRVIVTLNSGMIGLCNLTTTIGIRTANVILGRVGEGSYNRGRAIECESSALSKPEYWRRHL